MAREAAKKKIFYRSEYKDGQKFTSEPLIVETSVSVNDMMRMLSEHVSKEEYITSKQAVIYESSQFPGRIAYAYGNKSNPKIFEAVVLLTNTGTTTSVKFSILVWQEKDGIISGVDAMRKLREQVNTVFSAVKIS